ncbi:hypothetical protein J6590_035405 [Homalodisca vitripennis]|nr:hypothetical protein J6590_035405 [Homalodisca vitripennis]
METISVSGKDHQPGFQKSFFPPVIQEFLMTSMKPSTSGLVRGLPCYCHEWHDTSQDEETKLAIFTKPFTDQVTNPMGISTPPRQFNKNNREIQKGLRRIGKVPRWEW